MGGDKPMDACLRELEKSLSKANDLYYHLLDLIAVITAEEGLRQEILRQKAQREGSEVPSDRFVRNRFALQIRENETISAFRETRRHDWGNDIEYVRKLCDLIERSGVYREYMDSPEDSYEADREVWRKLYKQVVCQNGDLDALLEEESIYWNDDKEIVDTFILKTIKRFGEDSGPDQELLPDYKDPADRDFAMRLFSSAIENREDCQRYMEQASRNWEISRMPFLDIVIMQTALAEMTTFPGIPVSVTINEYVELSKTYSTPKSANFINAVLDSIARSLVEEGRLLKPINNTQL